MDMKYVNNDLLLFKIVYYYICCEVFVVFLFLFIIDNNLIIIGVNLVVLSGVKDCEYLVIVEFFLCEVIVVFIG